MRKEDKKHKIVILKVTFIVIVTYETMTPNISDRIKMEKKKLIMLYKAVVMYRKMTGTKWCTVFL